MNEDEYVAHLYLDTDPAVDEIKILKIKDPPNSRPEISYIIQFVFKGCVFECTKYHSGNEEFSYPLCTDIYTTIKCEQILNHMKHLELYRKEGETNMKDPIEIKYTESDKVNHPNHYNQGGMEVWDVIKAFTSNLSGAEAFYAGNAIKYILRWDKKNGIEDLEKAKVYIDKIIEGRKNKE